MDTHHRTTTTRSLTSSSMWTQDKLLPSVFTLSLTQHTTLYAHTRCDSYTNAHSKWLIAVDPRGSILFGGGGEHGNSHFYFAIQLATPSILAREIAHTSTHTPIFSNSHDPL